MSYENFFSVGRRHFVPQLDPLHFNSVSVVGTERGRLQVGPGRVVLVAASPVLLLPESEFPAAEDTRATREFGHEGLLEALVQRRVQNRVENGREKAEDQSVSVPEIEKKTNRKRFIDFGYFSMHTFAHYTISVQCVLQCVESKWHGTVINKYTFTVNTRRSGLGGKFSNTTVLPGLGPVLSP